MNANVSPQTKALILDEDISLVLHFSETFWQNQESSKVAMIKNFKS